VLPTRLALCVLLAGIVTAATGCGKKGPPLPPLRVLPRPPQSVRLPQIGPDVVLDAAVSLTRSDGSPLGPGAVARIERLRPGPALKTAGASARYLVQMFQKEAKVVGSVGGTDLQRVRDSGRLVYHDRGAAVAGPGDPPGASWPRYFYAVQIADERGERSPLSVPLEIQTVQPPPPPRGLKIETAEGVVRLSWEEGGAGKTGELFNVYRRTAAQVEEPLQPLNAEPLADRAYADAKFMYVETYRYSVRALLAPAPPMHESVPGDEVEVRPLDVYSPKAPTGLAAAVEGSAIKLYWFPNSEPDLRNYRVYRRTGSEELRLLGEVDATETSFADTTAERGVRYHYTVTAVDGATPPNESARSEEVSEGLAADAPG